MPHSKQFLNQLMNRSVNCVFFTDKDARLTMVSPPAREYFTPTENSGTLEGKLVRECISDTCLLNAFENADAALSQGQIAFHEVTPWRENEDQFALRFQGNKVVEDDGTFLGCIYTFAFENSSQQLEFDATMLNNLMQNSEDLIYFKDLNSKFTCVSDSMLEQLGAESVKSLSLIHI